MRKLSLTLSATIFAAAFAAPAFAAPLSLSDLPSFEDSSNYLGIHLGDKESGADVFSVGSDGGAAGSNNRSALGRINPTNDLPATSPGGGSIPEPLPSSGAQILPDGPNAPVARFGGNFALTGRDSQIEFSDTDTYAAGVSPGIGVECANGDCVKDNSNSNFFTPNGGLNPDLGLPIGIDQGQIDSGNGVTENVDFTDLLIEVNGVKSFLGGIQPAQITATLDLTTGAFGSDGEIDNFNPTDEGDFILGDHVSLVSGLNIIDISTDENDFSINNTNFIVDGESGDVFIFLVNDVNMLVTNSRILAGENMDLNNILFAVQTDTNDTHFNFSQAEVWGASFWDMSMGDNDFDGFIAMNNVRGCGQWVGNALKDWNDVSLDRCAFGPSREVPAPSSLGLFGFGLLGLGVLALRRRNRRSH